MSGSLVWTSFAGKRKEVSSSVEEASTLGNNSESGNVSPQQSILRAGDRIKGFFFQMVFQSNGYDCRSFIHH